MITENPVFHVGDFIRNKKPCPGESEYMVMEINGKDKCYNLATMKGKHCKKADFDNRLLLDFDPAHEYYEKVG